jgi:hypothetical protein
MCLRKACIQEKSPVKPLVGDRDLGGPSEGSSLTTGASASKMEKQARVTCPTVALCKVSAG